MNARQVTVVVTVDAFRPCGVEYGLQDKSGGLVAGDLRDGAVEFGCTITVRPGADGFGPPKGIYVHGKPGDLFLYLSFRGADGEWVRRTKIALPNLVAASADSLVTRVRDVGTVRLAVEDPWTDGPAAA